MSRVFENSTLHKREILPVLLPAWETASSTMNESAAGPVGCAGGLAQLRETGSTREATGIAGPFLGQYPSAQFKPPPTV